MLTKHGEKIEIFNAYLIINNFSISDFWDNVYYFKKVRYIHKKIYDIIKNHDSDFNLMIDDIKHFVQL